MAIEAPLSKFKKNNVKIYIVVLIGIAIWFGYDGYLNENFKEKHTDANGSPDSTLVFNQKSPPFLIGIAALLGVYLLAVRSRKLIADENTLIINDKERISYDSIQRIDRTYFGSKGHFTIVYRDKEGREISRKLSEKRYDNLGAILDHLVEKIR